MVELDPVLLHDCEVLGSFDLCQVLLMRDANYPWCILVPNVPGACEIFDLSAQQQQQLNLESNTLLAYLSREFQADKMNVAALGNVVSQLHIHHIVRYHNDVAWPKPVWGVCPAKAYDDKGLNELTSRLCNGFAQLGLGFQVK